MDVKQIQRIKVPSPTAENLLLERDYHYCRIKHLTEQIVSIFGA